jgi:16S rRNA (guanine1207-N2)-methyltransferase
MKSEKAPYPQEALLIDAVTEISGERILCTSAGFAQFAEEAARALPKAQVRCIYLDLYRAELALNERPELTENLRIECAADLPDEEVDVVAFPFSASGDSELTWELIQEGHHRLRIGGRLYASTNNRRDTWLRDQMGKVFRKLERRPHRTGVLYIGNKTEQLKKVKDFGCEFAFRDAGRLIRAYSRPGVFSHRRVDVGARHLMNEMQIEPGARVLDIGCGSGTVALAAGFRADGVHVHAIDSYARAVECARRGAELNGLTNVTTELNAAGRYSGGPYDLVVTNPPYYASYRIAEHFLVEGCEALRPRGRILVVTKQPDWYLENMPKWYADVTAQERKGYHVVHGTRPSGGN